MKTRTNHRFSLATCDIRTFKQWKKGNNTRGTFFKVAPGINYKNNWW
jgi:hypothetical protein